ncbi:MAG: hypothetical protein O9345_16250 [Burkholderiaceae bacterium]|nr:hypothetical protein [Burkholderiales bacterium]MCZ8339678.1 hypothetical protein [Burkholderiaceae bacterium]
MMGRAMDDRQLLEAAAKAAGIDPKWDGLYWQWNPLTDDGDALRREIRDHDDTAITKDQRQRIDALLGDGGVA